MTIKGVMNIMISKLHDGVSDAWEDCRDYNNKYLPINMNSE